MKRQARLESFPWPLGHHGVRGELRFLPYAFPCPTFKKDLTISLTGKDGLVRLLTVESVRPHSPFLLVRLQGITSLEQANELRDSIVSVEEHILPPLQDGEFYYYQSWPMAALLASLLAQSRVFFRWT
jgi:16S rRNA processing protein RimM